MAKLDSNGEVLWIETADWSNTSNWGEAFSLGLTTRGAVYVTGQLSGNLEFDTATASGAGLFDAFLTRIDSKPPLLSIFKSGTDAIVSWPLSAPDWLLQRKTQLGRDWETLTNLLFQTGDSFVLTNATTNSAEFFRLKLAE